MAEKKKYPVRFVRRVKDEYPYWFDLHKALEGGSGSDGRYLDNGSGGSISPRDIITMIDQGLIKELRRRADRLARRKELYSDWGIIAREMFLSCPGRLV